MRQKHRDLDVQNIKQIKELGGVSNVTKNQQAKFKKFEGNITQLLNYGQCFFTALSNNICR